MEDLAVSDLNSGRLCAADLPFCECPGTGLQRSKNGEALGCVISASRMSDLEAGSMMKRKGSVGGGSSGIYRLVNFVLANRPSACIRQHFLHISRSNKLHRHFSRFLQVTAVL